jgi:hypothetical protein
MVNLQADPAKIAVRTETCKKILALANAKREEYILLMPRISYTLTSPSGLAF